LEEGLNYQSIALQKLFSRQRISMGQTIDFGRTMTHPANQQMIANIIYGGQWGSNDP
jgi:putative chitinase